jgi:hypothetical protein
LQLLLQGPGQAGPPPCLPARTPGQACPPSPPHWQNRRPRKRKQGASPVGAAVGGYRPILGGLDDERGRSDPEPGSSLLVQRKNGAYDIWAFVRAVNTDEELPSDEWPNDYDQHLTCRPETEFIGCKLCTQFG